MKKTAVPNFGNWRHCRECQSNSLISSSGSGTSGRGAGSASSLPDFFLPLNMVCMLSALTSSAPQCGHLSKDSEIHFPHPGHSVTGPSERGSSVFSTDSSIFSFCGSDLTAGFSELPLFFFQNIVLYRNKEISLFDVCTAEMRISVRPSRSLKN